MAKDEVYGTPDTDGDGDGDPVGNGYTFLVGPPLPLPNDPNGPEVFNEMYVNSNMNTEYWSGNNAWENYELPEDSSNLPSAHLLDSLSPGDDYWYNLSFKYAMCEYAMGWEELNGVFPSGTIVTFGLALFDTSDRIEPDDDITNVGNLTPVSTGVAPPDFSPSGPEFEWFSYSVDAQDEPLEWELKADTECIHEVVFYFELPDVIPAGETLPQGNEWTLSGYDKDGDFESVEPGDVYYTTTDGDEGPSAQDDPTTDAVFAWTVDNRGEFRELTWGPLVAPEPNQSVLILVPALASVFLRKKRSVQRGKKG